jgi:hypothetical protein
LRLRQTASAPVLAKIEALTLLHLHRVLPQSLLGRALHYLHEQWPKLVRFLDDGHYPIDNNACENAIRPFVIGRNYPRSTIRQGAAPRAATCVAGRALGFA